MSREDIATLEAAGAVGDVLCHFVNENGEIISHPVNDCDVAVNPMDLRAACNVMLVSGGWQKLRVISAAMRLLRPSVLLAN